ncbi:MAG: lmo0937 family membrane protein [Syntrophaceae bacterium]
MLWIILAVILLLWLLGVLTSYTLGGFIHLLLFLAIIVLVARIIQWAAAFSEPPNPVT